MCQMSFLMREFLSLRVNSCILFFDYDLGSLIWICFCSFRYHMTTSIQPIEIKNTVETLLSNTLIDTYLPSWQEMLARNLKKYIFI